MLWAWGLRRFVRHGFLEVYDARGCKHAFGVRGRAPECAIRLHDASLHHKLLINPGLYLGEAYVDGTLTLEQGHLYDLLYLFGLNVAVAPTSLIERFFESVGRLRQNWVDFSRLQSKHNVAHHYDLSGSLYERFLDPDLQYSCAYFVDGNTDDLTKAQLDKKRHIAAKLNLKSGQRVLDIGCGWGGLALYLAKEHNVQVTGLTLSQEQHTVACKRTEEAGLTDKVKFKLQDYRDESQFYDRIVSVGMFEHVGVRHYPEFFAGIKRILVPDGVALLHSIGRADAPGVTNPWLSKYIFPGGYAPALSEVLPAIERTGLWVSDVEVLRLHYAETLKAWRRNFDAAREDIVQLYDERFCRMWEFYLIGAEIDFRLLSTMVFQIQLTPSVDALPITRDYMFDAERGTA